jgi:hypothetical protein
VPPGDAVALAAAIAAAARPAGARATAEPRRERVRRTFSLEAMVAGVLDGYREALTARFLRVQ